MPAGTPLPLKLNVAVIALSPARIAPSAGAVMQTVLVYVPPTGPLVWHGLAAACAGPAAPRSPAITAAATTRRRLTLCTTCDTTYLPSPENGPSAGRADERNADEQWDAVTDVRCWRVARVEVA